MFRLMRISALLVELSVCIHEAISYSLRSMSSWPLEIIIGSHSFVFRPFAFFNFSLFFFRSSHFFFVITSFLLKSYFIWRTALLSKLALMILRSSSHLRNEH